jgi:hypothetical protein
LYKALGCLATHGFSKNLWQLLLQYGFTLHLPSTTAISLLKEDDQPLIDAIHDKGIFTTKEIVDINKFHHWKKVHSIGDLVLCDGLTIKPSMIMRTEGSSSREFPLQQPTREVFTLWKHAIGSLSISGTKLHNPQVN